MSGPAIYLDHAATTMLAPEIGRLMADMLARPSANPASQHRAGREAHARLEDAKDRIKAACLGTQTLAQLQTWQIVTTSGGTEANNLALPGLAGPHATPVYVGASEHPSVLSLATDAQPFRERCRVLPLDGRTGQVNIDALEGQLRAALNSSGPTGRPPARALVSIMLGNNETGILSDIGSVSRICRRFGAILHCDAIQAVSRVAPEEFVPWVDAFSISAHKLHGPIGVGALLVRTELPLRPLFFGGGQQLALRPGSESVLLVSALAAAVELAERHRQAGAMEQLTQLRLQFETLLRTKDLGAMIIGENLPRLPHITSVAFPGLDRQGLLMALDLNGIHCSSGSACASGSSQPSHVLSAMGLPQEWIEGAIRFSFSRFTSADEITEAVDRISLVIGRLRNRA